MNKIKNKALIIFCIFAFLIFLPKICNATYLNVSCPSNGNPGDKVDVSISTDCIGRFNISVSNGTLIGESRYWLEFSSASFSVVLGQSGVTNISVTPANPVSFNRADVNLDAKVKGITINSAEKPSTSGEETSQKNTGSIQTEKTVKTIITSPVDFSGFRTNNKGPYRVTVENNVTQLKITVKYSDGTSNTITKNLTEGSNSFNVDGYNIIAIRKVAEGEETVPNTIDKEEKKEDEEEQEEKILRLENIVLDDELNVKLDPNFDPEVFEYKVVLGNNYLDLEKILISAMANIEGATITIDGNEDLIDGDNIVTITVEAEGYNTVWYRINVIKGATEEIIVYAPEKEDYNITEVVRNKIIISASTVLIVLIAIVFLIKERYESKNKKEEKNSSAWEDEPLIKDYSFKSEDVDEQKNIVENLYSNKNVEESKEESVLDSIDENSFLRDNVNNEELSAEEKIDKFLNKLKSLNTNEEPETLKDEPKEEEKDEELEKIKEEFFSAERIEFDEKVKRERKERRRGKGKHA